MHKDRVMAIMIIIFAVFVFALTFQVPRGNVAQDPGPRIFPEVVAMSLAALALGLFFTAGARKKQEKPKEISMALDEVQDIVEPVREKAKRILTCIVLLAVYTVTLPVLGFIATTIIFGVVFLMVLYRMKLLKCIVPSVAITILSFLLFEIGFGIPLPRFLQFFR